MKPADKEAADNGDSKQQERIELEKNTAAIRQLTRQIRAIEYMGAGDGDDNSPAPDIK